MSLVEITSCVIFLACKKDDPIAPLSPTINKLPTARAGSDVTVTLPANSVLLDGSASGDIDGNIRKYYWSDVAIKQDHIKPCLSWRMQKTLLLERPSLFVKCSIWR